MLKLEKTYQGDERFKLTKSFKDDFDLKKVSRSVLNKTDFLNEIEGEHAKENGEDLKFALNRKSNNWEDEDAEFERRLSEERKENLVILNSIINSNEIFIEKKSKEKTNINNIKRYDPSDPKSSELIIKETNNEENLEVPYLNNSGKNSKETRPQPIKIWDLIESKKIIDIKKDKLNSILTNNEETKEFRLSSAMDNNISINDFKNYNQLNEKKGETEKDDQLLNNDPHSTIHLDGNLTKSDFDNHPNDSNNLDMKKNKQKNQSSKISDAKIQNRENKLRKKKKHKKKVNVNDNKLINFYQNQYQMNNENAKEYLRLSKLVSTKHQIKKTKKIKSKD